MSCFSSLKKPCKQIIYRVVAKFSFRRKDRIQPAEVEEPQRMVVVHRHIVYIMLCTRATRVSYDCSTGSFPSSSCHGEVTQFEYRGGLKKSSLGGLRRNSSHGYEMDSFRGGICEADATNIEIDLTSFTQIAFDVKIETPTGEIGFMTFTTTGVAQSFTPALNGCGHGTWTIRIFKQLQSGHEEVSCESVEINGVGTLFFTVDETLIPRHEAHNFLQMRMCPKHRHQ